MGNPHVLVVPYPAQGHIIPLLELSNRLAQHGFDVTFVNTQHIDEKVKNAMSLMDSKIRVVLIEDGLSLEDRKRAGKLSESVLRVMPRKVEELIEKINGLSFNEGDEISCVVCDQSLGWALDIAERKGIKKAAFCPAAAALLVQGFSIPRLIDEGIIDKDGKIPFNRLLVNILSF